jgi:phytoene synthase
MSTHIEAWEQPLLALAYAPLEEWAADENDRHAAQKASRTAYALCNEITREHSRSFHMVSALLPGKQRRGIRALYAFCRVSDDLIDLPGPEREARFRQWRKDNFASPPPTDNLVAQAWMDTRQQFGIPGKYVEQLLDGVECDLKACRYATFAELAHYCYGVASTVGLMSMHIVGYAGEEAIPYAVKLGVALQLTNILRDIGQDWDNGRLYLPLDELAAFELAEADIAAHCTDQRWRRFMQYQIERARRLYAEALPGIAMLSRRGRPAVAAAAEFYRAILTDIEVHDYDVFTRRAYVSDRDKLFRIPAIWWRASVGQY